MSFRLYFLLIIDCLSQFENNLFKYIDFVWLLLILL